MDDERFSLSDVARIFKIERPRLQEWLRLKFLLPKFASPGPGSMAFFSKNDLYCIRLFIELLESGFNRDDAAFIVKTVQGKLSVRWHTRFPCDWDDDFLNISKNPSFEEGNNLSDERFIVTYGNPDISHYYIGQRKAFETKPYWNLIIRLNEIKERVDRSLR
jgi:hypothetical protein